MKRFYKAVTVAAEAGGFRVQLDGRGIRTVGGRAQIVPSAALAEALAAEWAGQADEIDPAAFVLRDLTDYALDVVEAGKAGVIEELVPYGETDTLCYRAEPDEALGVRQRAAAAIVAGPCWATNRPRRPLMRSCTSGSAT